MSEASTVKKENIEVKEASIQERESDGLRKKKEWKQSQEIYFRLTFLFQKQDFPQGAQPFCSVLFLYTDTEARMGFQFLAGRAFYRR